jgi:hypothetical protein
VHESSALTIACSHAARLALPPLSRFPKSSIQLGYIHALLTWWSGPASITGLVVRGYIHHWSGSPEENVIPEACLHTCIQKWRYSFRPIPCRHLWVPSNLEYSWYVPYRLSSASSSATHYWHWASSLYLSAGFLKKRFSQFVCAGLHFRPNWMHNGIRFCCSLCHFQLFHKRAKCFNSQHREWKCLLNFVVCCQLHGASTLAPWLGVCLLDPTWALPQTTYIGSHSRARQKSWLRGYSPQTSHPGLAPASCSLYLF